ncbi:MAG: hypothetical protein ABFR36_05030 [Acidobacteriota bacterium]
MKITTVTSVSDNTGMTDFRTGFSDELKSRGHKHTDFDLNQMDIRSCAGCWDCWVKTPGKCVIRDDMEQVLKGIIRSDMTVFIAKPVLGYVNGTMKMAMDRTIPLVHPYIKLVQNECHHRKRYHKYPLFGLILEDSGELEPEDRDIIEHLFRRYTLNLKSELKMFRDTSNTIMEVVDEINSI